MRQHRYLYASVILVAVLGLFAGSALADSIKERMKNRLPVVIELKRSGIVGETRHGLLAYVGERRIHEALVAEENNDRQTIYEAIAKQQGTTAAKVGMLRALKIAEQAEPGEWLQGDDGKWYRK